MIQQIIEALRQERN